ncbi:chromate transporter [Tissierella creatinini]|nr:chromate transporter [Tissierella creatinini]TJX56842.1 chromate transporter [Soehngenia saccharolytica]
MDNLDYKSLSKKEKINRQKEIVKVFLKFGFIAFGGPAAHIAMMDEEIIEKRKWISREKFLDFMGASNLIPGPNSTEMVIYLGSQRGGNLGLFLAGASFIIPAMIITLIFAYFYKNYGTIPQVSSILYGIKPAIIAVIIQALLRLRKSVIKDKPSFLFVLISIGIYLLGVGEIPLLLISSLIMLIIKNSHELKDRFLSLPLAMIFWLFLKIGLVLYGSGYVLLAFLEAEFVGRLGVLTTTQIIDAIAIGQFKPGPVFATATFIGYLLHGIPGAILATIGIFLPAFLLVLILNPIMHKLRESKILSAMLDGVNIGSLVLMLVVSIKLGMASITNWITAIIFLVSYVAITKLKINSVWTIIAGGVIGFIVL